MSFDLTTRPFWRLPAVFDEDEDNWIAPFSANSGISISEDEKNVFVSVAIPGVDEKDIEVTFDKGTLWVKGESAQEEADKKRKYYRKSANAFSYRVSVPGDIDSTKEPDATSKNGVMTVTFSKSPSSQPKKIAVKSQK